MTELEEIYNSLPKITCQGKCQECCGPIGIFPAEADNIKSSNHSLPSLNSELTCSKLVPVFGTCSIYQQRPLICRLWGIAKEMPCPFGCKPERYLSREEANALIKRIHDLKSGKPITTL
jgi:hypothetical protein